MSSRSPFSTSDLRHACFLLAKGFSFLGADTDNGRVKFSFGCSPEEARVYFTPADEVSCGRLFSAWKSLRSIIDEHRGNRSPNKSMDKAHEHTYR